MQGHKRANGPVLGAVAIHKSGNMNGATVYSVTDDGKQMTLLYDGYISPPVKVEHYNFFIPWDAEEVREQKRLKRLARELQATQPGLKYTAALRSIKEQESNDLQSGERTPRN